MPETDIQRLMRMRATLTSPASRRRFLHGLAALLLLRVEGTRPEAVSARREGIQADKKRKRKTRFCLDGRSIRGRNKRKRKRLRREGAVRGKCDCAPNPSQDTCAGRCDTIQDNCGRPVDCGFSSVAPVAEVQATFGTAGSGQDQFQGPHALAVTRNELVVYVADFGNDRISVWSRPSPTSADWTDVTTFGDSGPGSLDGPAGVTLSRDEMTLYVADYGNDRVTIWSRNTKETQDWEFAGEFGISGQHLGMFNGPRGLALTSDERTMYVADSNNGRVSIWSRPSTSGEDWEFRTWFGSKGTGPYELNQPWDLQLSADDLTIYIADRDNFRVSIWTRTDPNGLGWYNQATFGTNFDGPDQLLLPSGLGVATDELAIWVADTDNNRMSIWSRPSIDAQDWAPLSTFGTQGDLPEDFDDPLQARVSADSGTLWVVDSLNNRISVWTQTCPA